MNRSIRPGGDVVQFKLALCVTGGDQVCAANADLDARQGLGFVVEDLAAEEGGAVLGGFGRVGACGVGGSLYASDVCKAGITSFNGEDDGDVG